jgi:hypothetical protein
MPSEALLGLRSIIKLFSSYPIRQSQLLPRYQFTGRYFNTISLFRDFQIEDSRDGRFILKERKSHKKQVERWDLLII